MNSGMNKADRRRRARPTTQGETAERDEAQARLMSLFTAATCHSGAHAMQQAVASTRHGRMRHASTVAKRLPAHSRKEKSPNFDARREKKDIIARCRP